MTSLSSSETRYQVAISLADLRASGLAGNDPCIAQLSDLLGLVPEVNQYRLCVHSESRRAAPNLTRPLLEVWNHLDTADLSAFHRFPTREHSTSLVVRICYGVLI